MPGQYVKLPASILRRSSSLSMQPGDTVELPHGVSYESTGTVQSRRSSDGTFLTFVGSGTLKILPSSADEYSTMVAEPTAASTTVQSPAQTDNVPASSRVDEGGVVKGGMYVDRVGRGEGSFDVLYSKTGEWAVKLGCVMPFEQMYTWNLSVGDWPGVASLPPSEGWERWGVSKGQEPTVSISATEFHCFESFQKARSVLKGMLQKSYFPAKLRYADLDDPVEKLVVENLIDRILVMIEEFKGVDTSGKEEMGQDLHI